MDPNAALLAFLELCEDMAHALGPDADSVHLRECIREEAGQVIDGLSAWIRGGGFLPDSRVVCERFLAALAR